MRGAWALGVLVVLLQIAYPLVHGPARGTLTVVTVCSFALATLLWVAVTRGLPDAVLLLVVAGGVGYGVEVLGVHTGVPFGHYSYSNRLGALVADVPIVIPLAWTMMAWPALIAARTLATGVVSTAALGGLGLASWDLFLDPQMVAAANWSWRPSGPALQGIPLLNDLGWLVTAVALAFVLDRLLPRRAADDDRLPLALYLWTYAGSVLANAAFFGRPAVALIGGIGMGLVALPLAARLTHHTPRRLALR